MSKNGLLMCFVYKRGKVGMKGTVSEKVYIEYCIAKYSESMFRAAYSILGSVSESEDAVQETFIRLYSQSPKFTDENHEKAWLLRVTMNQAKNQHRKLRRLQEYDEGCDKVTFADEKQRAVYDAVRTLDEKYRTVVHLHFFEGYTIKEIAEILSIPPSTAGTRLERAKAQLRALLEKEGI